METFFISMKNIYLYLVVLLVNVAVVSYHLSEYVLCEEPELDPITFFLDWLGVYTVEKVCPSLESKLLVIRSFLMWEALLLCVAFHAVYFFVWNLTKIVMADPIVWVIRMWAIISEIRRAIFYIRECHQAIVPTVMWMKRIVGLAGRDDCQYFHVSVYPVLGGALFRRISETADDIVFRNDKTGEIECIGSYRDWRRQLFSEEPELDTFTFFLDWLGIYTVEKVCPSLESKLLVIRSFLMWEALLLCVAYHAVYFMVLKLTKIVMADPIVWVIRVWAVISEIRRAILYIRECHQAMVPTGTKPILIPV